ncbi:hypothetical protein EC973_009616 [Apophysomyces ossiformis]|uniref:Uncharacterized protein n=1 Tax=Apophysomyces ossiformis TaxID=679940 RepID=A0A8H7ENA9_9FUNG|nr:hypothetical protein EC973_009616 [Apophysomyces ossiformis]
MPFDLNTDKVDSSLAPNVNRYFHITPPRKWEFPGVTQFPDNVGLTFNQGKLAYHNELQSLAKKQALPESVRIIAENKSRQKITKALLKAKECTNDNSINVTCENLSVGDSSNLVIGNQNRGGFAFEVFTKRYGNVQKNAIEVLTVASSSSSAAEEACNRVTPTNKSNNFIFALDQPCQTRDGNESSVNTGNDNQSNTMSDFLRQQKQLNGTLDHSPLPCAAEATANVCDHLNIPVSFWADIPKLSDSSILPEPLPSIDPAAFRELVFGTAVKALNKSLCMQDVAKMRTLIKSYNATTIGQQLDKMAANVVVEGVNDDIKVNALKLSLSRIIDCVNPKVNAVFRERLGMDLPWESISAGPSIGVTGLKCTSRRLYEDVLTASSDDKGNVTKELLNMVICRKKLELYEAGNNDREAMQVLDVLATASRLCLDDSALDVKGSMSELTYYRKIAYILDIILDDTRLDLIDGEIMSNVSKQICRQNDPLYAENGAVIMKGRRIDLIIQSKNVELSSNEWKRRVTLKQSTRQQAKNFRMNKGMLKQLLSYPLDLAERDNVYTLGMDWTGPVGYMFSVSPYQDAYVAAHQFSLMLPEYLSELRSFINTLNALYIWKQHHCQLKDIILPVIISVEKNNALANLIPGPPPSTPLDISPNAFYTPGKRRMKHAGVTVGCAPKKGSDTDSDSSP